MLSTENEGRARVHESLSAKYGFGVCRDVNTDLRGVVWCGHLMHESVPCFVWRGRPELQNISLICWSQVIFIIKKYCLTTQIIACL
jgi:hypothetical protein